MVRIRDWVVLSGNSNRALAEKICERLHKPLGLCEIRRFSDGEIFAEIGDNVRGRDAYVIQSTCGPVNDNLMELLIIIDALKRASAKEITAVIPYYGYARQDRKVAPRTPISAKLVADLLTAAGATRVVSMDLHAGQIQGFFNIPLDNIFSSPVHHNYIRTQYKPQGDLVIVSPDAGGVERARAYAKRLDASVAMIDKRRTAPNVAKAMNVVGEVDGKIAVIVDDMIDTAGTLTEAAHAVLDRGALKVYATVTHGVLSGPAVERIQNSRIEEVVITDTIPLSQESRNCKKIVQLSVADILAQAIERIHNYESVSSLFV
ncbi:MAG TPA: phosphoribosylpyrophosphate synthetase [Bdellovibrionales bacterium]|nr:MAG: phosphoribosylpyrophosphate synthetase [Bdellovibrionales bacterium GWB1_52_6]OFZ05829.1 MAG: phosphoribosylpyrophosphate synthetase [Bdellovibrionales bacterium GWA1_52_35]OFZ39338.1 MAG: phosphoribosylpyrophosphate synthetase [Bdellovibrionales bacterium GWC1_52_8]HAR43579.1 phosphoribosylpyrophosphate synthetase [Bdellovibrionales bacterium]HCM40226.1 phosphoribosylpyrophosphate synthetase [Bdellovibrionales bacterium]